MNIVFVHFYRQISNRLVWLHIAAWGLLLLLPYLIGSPANHYSIGTLPGIFFTATGFLHIGLFYGNAYFLYPKLYTVRRWFIYLVAAIALIVLIILVKHYLLVNWFPWVTIDKNSWRLMVAPTAATFFISIVYRTITDKNRAEKELQEKKAVALSGELKFLRSQISPHFMFNVLTNLVALARKKSEQLEPALLMLSGLMRYMLFDTRNSKISLQHEIEYLKNYMALQQLRFGTAVRVETAIDLLDVEEAPAIEPMLLIPFVENAFKHGAGCTVEPWITVQLTIQQNILHFEVKNNYADPVGERQDTGSGTGIENVRARLAMLYKDQYTLNISRGREVFSVQLTLTL